MGNGVLAENIGRQDILLLRGATNRIGARWQRQSKLNGPFESVDLSDWQCTFQVLSADGQLWYERGCDAHGADGLAAVYVPPNAFSAPAWTDRRSGSWKIIASRAGVTEILGWGYWTLAD